jgi:membrane protein required for beta-lactamase induction
MERIRKVLGDDIIETFTRGLGVTAGLIVAVFVLFAASQAIIHGWRILCLLGGVFGVSLAIGAVLNRRDYK